jgi:hypothetical protein
MAVNREDLAIERVEKYAAGYFGPHPRKRTKKLFRVLGTHRPKWR